MSHVLPPSSSGQAVVLYRLLKECAPGQYCLLSIQNYEPELTPTPEMGAITARLGGKYYSLPSEKTARERIATGLHDLLRRGYGKMRRLIPVAASAQDGPKSDTPAQQIAPAQARAGWKDRCKSFLSRMGAPSKPTALVRQRARAILRIIQKEQCQALVACSGDLIDIPAAWQAAQQARIPFYPYLFDDYLEQWVAPWQRQFAQEVFPAIVRQAAGLIVPNEFLARSYRDAYAVKPVVVPNPVAEISAAPQPILSGSRGPLRIVYTGAIYDAHFDSFRHLLEAVRQSPADSFELHIYTSMDRQFLAHHRIGSPAIFHPAVSAARAQQLQREADVLFLPLAFASPFPEIIRTSAPGKMGELLASGRPVLVHAPRNSFVSAYCRENACAIVVDEPAPHLLRDVLGKLLLDRSEPDRMVHTAWECARRDFAPDLARSRFFQLFRGH